MQQRRTIRSELESIVLAPLLHDLDEIFHLRVGGVLQHLDDLNESLFVLSAGNSGSVACVLRCATQGTVAGHVTMVATRAVRVVKACVAIARTQ